MRATGRGLFAAMYLSTAISCSRAPAVPQATTDGPPTAPRPSVAIAVDDDAENSPSAAVADAPVVAQVAANGGALAIFDRRILPILRSPKPSSCSECHLSGVDLKDYVRPTQTETFAALREAGLIDPEQPDESKLLRFIARRPEKPSLVTDAVRREEFDAFRAWIRAAVAEPALLAAPAAERPVGTELPVEVVRHARKDRVLASFVENVWSEVARCAACHSPDRNQKQVREHGERVSWIRLRDPQGTLDRLLEQDLVDVESPEKSLLLAKPTLQVEHGGGQKLVVGDRTYQQFRRFLKDYAAIAKGKYVRADQLPPPAEELSQATDVWLKIEGVPARFDKQLLQVDVHAATEAGWTERRVATSDRLVFGAKNLWQHSLSLTARRGSAEAATLRSERLPPGRYRLKLFVDRQGQLAQDPMATLGETDFVGQVDVESQWPAGYARMTTVRFPER